MRQYPVIPRVYELMIILNPDVTDEELGPALDEVTRYIEDAGATLEALNTASPWGRRRLAYSIRFNGRDVRDGYYSLYHFTSDPAQVAEVERELKLDTRVMRYIMTRSTPEAAEANKPAPDDEPEATVGEAAGTGSAEITPTPETVPVVTGDVSGTEDSPDDPALARSDEPMPTAEANPTDTSIVAMGEVGAPATAPDTGQEVVAAVEDTGADTVASDVSEGTEGTTTSRDETPVAPDSDAPEEA
ncbi:MAG: 30S ribosomal protein S6 [Chloroflexia bacterium]|nr:30S ribosomal protein S6 [Chloroflexia bacterium]